MASDQNKAQCPRPAVGGQAVVEGVMMRSPTATAVAVRKPDASLIVRTRHAVRSAERWPILEKPGFRGIVILLETMADGMSALNFSAVHSMPDDENSNNSDTDNRFAIFLTMAVAFLFAFAIFAALPHFLTWALGWLVNSPDLMGGRALLFHLVDGIIKMGIFLGYVYAMSLIKDMRRVFEYHGAEHQAVHTFEHGLELTPENMSTFPTAHPRCGTALIVTVIAVSILVFAGVFPLFPPLAQHVFLNQTLYVLIKLPLILPIAALSYELIRLAGRRKEGLLMALISAPGVFFQRITTQPPDAQQQQVAIVSLNAAMWPEKMGVSSETTETILHFASFEDFLAIQATQETQS